jgi:hypothetical protein
VLGTNTQTATFKIENDTSLDRLKTFLGSQTVNPFLLGGNVQTPHLSGVLATTTATATAPGQLAAESYGVLGKYKDATSGWVPMPAKDLLSRALVESKDTFSGGVKPGNALAAVIRVDKGLANTLFGSDFTGYDLLLYVNLTNDSIASPSMGINGQSSPLLQGHLCHAHPGGERRLQHRPLA